MVLVSFCMDRQLAILSRIELHPTKKRNGKGEGTVQLLNHTDICYCVPWWAYANCWTLSDEGLCLAYSIKEFTVVNLLN